MLEIVHSELNLRKLSIFSKQNPNPTISMKMTIRVETYAPKVAAFENVIRRSVNLEYGNREIKPNDNYRWVSVEGLRLSHGKG